MLHHILPMNVVYLVVYTGPYMVNVLYCCSVICCLLDRKRLWTQPGPSWMIHQCAMQIALFCYILSHNILLHYYNSYATS